MITIQTFTFNPFQENTYLLFDETHEAIIIDPGCNSSTEKAVLKEFISDNRLIIKRLLNTHCHIDHVFGNQWVKDNYQVKLEAHQKDIPTLKACKFASEMYGIKPFIESEIDVFLNEGDKIEFGNAELDILFVPGHAPGHIAFVNQNQKFVINGDCLFRESVGRTDFPGCSHQDLMNSIRNKLFTLGDDFTVYAGHGPTTTIGHEKKYNPFLK